jgi:hypothetical protein
VFDNYDPPLMHMPRPPAFDHGVVSFIWGLGLGIYVWLGLLAVGVDQAVALIFGALSAGAIFLFVRLYGDEEPRRQPEPPAPRP